jgi:hypothetical protein
MPDIQLDAEPRSSAAFDNPEFENPQ